MDTCIVTHIKELLIDSQVGDILCFLHANENVVVLESNSSPDFQHSQLDLDFSTDESDLDSDSSTDKHSDLEVGDNDSDCCSYFFIIFLLQAIIIWHKILITMSIL